MERYFYKTIFAIIALTMFGSVYAAPRTPQQLKSGNKKETVQARNKAQTHTYQEMSETQMSGMMNEPHHVLEVAYKETIATFANALREQAQTGSLSSDFARLAAAEIGRCLDQVDEHHREHVKTMSAEMRSNMTATMKEMDMSISSLKNAFKVLEKDVAAYTLNAKQIATDSDVILKLLN